MGHELILLQQFLLFPPKLAEHYQLHLETPKDQVQPLKEVPWALAGYGRFFGFTYTDQFHVAGVLTTSVSVSS